MEREPLTQRLMDQLLERLAATRKVIVGEIRLEIPGRPVPWERVRTNHGKFFKPQRTRDYEEAVAWACRATREKIGDTPCDITIEFHVDKTVVILTPVPDAPKRKLLGDVDNYAKSVLDGLQQGQMIDNDRQVSELHVSFPAPSD